MTNANPETNTTTTSSKTAAHASGVTTHRGGCHCGAVRFEVDVDVIEAASRCNCSICTKVAQTGAIVKPESFRLLAGEDSLTFYSWGAKIARRAFCKRCGVHCFGAGTLAELGGAFVSANLNCLDDVDPGELHPKHWDGRHDNWEAGPQATPWAVFSR